MSRADATLSADIRTAMVQAAVDHLCASLQRLPTDASRKRVLMHLHTLRPEWDIPIEAVMRAAGLAEA